MKVLNELYTVMKTYHMYNADSISAQCKLKEAEKQEEKQMSRSVRQEDRQTPRSPDTATSVRLDEKHIRRSSVRKIEKMKEKRQAKYTENKVKAIKARNEYVLALEATNASVFKYYIHDLSDLIDCCDLGYHSSLHRALRTFLSAEFNLQHSKQEGLEALENATENLDATSDKQRLMESSNSVFCPPVRFEFQPHMGDSVSQLCGQQPLQGELAQRCQQLQCRLSTLHIENEEVKKTMEATLQTIQEMVSVEDFDVSDCFQYSNSMESVKSTVSETYMSKPSIAKRRANQQETEQFYFTKMKEFLEGRNLITKLKAKHDMLQKTLGECQRTDCSLASGRRMSTLRKQDAKQPIPLVVESCIRFLSRHGLQHEGIFRVSGSQVEVNDIKNAFERALDNMQERASHIRKVLLCLHSPTLVLMRYLFAFLNHSTSATHPELHVVIGFFHISVGMRRPDIPTDVVKLLHDVGSGCSFSTHPLPILQSGEEGAEFRLRMRGRKWRTRRTKKPLSQFSDDNMMDPYNLAICFGPTLVCVPDNVDQVSCQSHVNEFIKTIIMHHESIFPGQRELDGPVYMAGGGGEDWNLAPKPYFCRQADKKGHSRESNALAASNDANAQLLSALGTTTLMDFERSFPYVRLNCESSHSEPISTEDSGLDMTSEMHSTEDGSHPNSIAYSRRIPASGSDDPPSERSSPRSDPEQSSEPLVEEKVTARASLSCPTGSHVADIYLANINKQRKRPESGSIRRPFRQSDSVSSSDTSEPASPGANVRPTSQPVMSQTFSREAPDRCSISGHGTVSSISRHSSLKNRMDSPQIRKAMAAGRSKSFNNHRPLDPEVIAQDIEATMNSALNELRELERQSSAKHAPDVVLDTLEPLKTSPVAAPNSEPSSPLHAQALRDQEPGFQRSSSSASDIPCSFRTAKSVRLPPSRPPATRPKPAMFPKSNPPALVVLDQHLVSSPLTSLARCDSGDLGPPL
ncbi:unnamed protein product [Ranitomeya imitator]|uniref:Uncharacterized protein n=1 Tax=Ranitomeya imitator TaxID=111125 RepID=A0ABN9LSM6_9NEOB|nr:unnamed protein product [Ranitomeya imitator]